MSTPFLQQVTWGDRFSREGEVQKGSLRKGEVGVQRKRVQKTGFWTSWFEEMRGKKEKEGTQEVWQGTQVLEKT